jgi:uncharacterized phage infection (PIP) family protein YhgE
MQEILNLKNVVEDIISSYETRIGSISSVFDAAQLILANAQESIHNTREETEKLNTQLKDILAKNEHLRRKDFDNMMQGILSTQDEREKEVKNLLNSYLNEQKEIIQTLRERLRKFKDYLAQNDGQRIEESGKMVKEILAEQNERREKVISKLREFQKEQRMLAKKLKALLERGNELRIKDLRIMLKEFESQRKERIVRQEKRREEVLSMLKDFKNERDDMTKNWQTMWTAPL